MYIFPPFVYSTTGCHQGLIPNNKITARLSGDFYPPPSSEGGGFCAGKDGGRESYRFLSPSQKSEIFGAVKNASFILLNP